MAVYARDGINHGVGDEFVIVTVQLLDVNDNPPVFQNFQNSIDVPEVNSQEMIELRSNSHVGQRSRSNLGYCDGY